MLQIICCVNFRKNKNVNRSIPYLKGLSNNVDLFHNFPLSMDEKIVKLGSWSQRLKDGADWYELPGSINGMEGVYQLGINKSGVVFHRNFIPK